MMAKPDDQGPTIATLVRESFYRLFADTERVVTCFSQGVNQSSAGVDKVNAVLAPVRLSISASGEPSWSYKNRGYGAYRRVLLQGESVDGARTRPAMSAASGSDRSFADFRYRCSDIVSTPYTPALR